MKSSRNPLVRHLALAIALKLAVLAALWWVFIRDARVGVDAEGAAAHLGTAVISSVPAPAHHGAHP